MMHQAITTEEYILRDDSTTAAGLRSKNIIIFSEHSDTSLFFKFKGDGLRAENFSIMDNSVLAEQVSMNYKHRKLDIQVPFDGRPLYFRVRLKTTKSSETHYFKILILQKDSFYLRGVKNYFLVKPKEKELLLKLNSFELNFALTQTGQTYSLPADAKQVNVVEHPHLDITKFYDAHDEVKFTITNGFDSLTVALENEKIEDTISIPLLFNTQRAGKLFADGVNAEYNQAKRRRFLIIGVSARW